MTWCSRRARFLGVVDARATADQFPRCLRRLLYVGHEMRGTERGPRCLPVELVARGISSPAYATSLAAGGMGLATVRRPESGEEVGLRWTDDPSASPVAVKGGVVYCHASSRPDADYETDDEMGVDFISLSERSQRRVRIL